MDWPQRKFFCVNSFTMLQLLELFVKFSPSNYFRWFMINTDQMFDLVHLLGFEKQMFNRMNEKQATEREAYLWSVSDM